MARQFTLMLRIVYGSAEAATHDGSPHAPPHPSRLSPSLRLNQTQYFDVVADNWERQKSNDRTSSFNFSACLLVKDANQILPEWLAYHFTVLTLRRLIVAVDPFSQTDPKFILNLYREIGMDITVWRDDTFIFDGPFPRKKLFKNLTGPPFLHTKRDFKLAPNSTDDDKLARYQWRQTCFYTKCLQHLKEEKRSWTALIDADEYVSFNYYSELEGPPYWCLVDESNRTRCHLDYLDSLKNGTHSRTRLPPPNRNITASQFIETGSDPMFHRLNYECIVFGRVLFGALESPAVKIKSFMPAGFDPKIFRTMRYRKHEPLQSFLGGKAFVDVSRYEGQRIKGPHQPLHNRCQNGPRVKNAAMSFRIHHYTGSLEEFLRPGYDSRGAEAFNQRQSYNVAGEDDSMRWWLRRFVSLVGRERAAMLTEAVRSFAVVEMQELMVHNLPSSNS